MKKITSKSIYQNFAIILGISLFFGVGRYIKQEKENLQKVGIKSVCLIHTVGSNVRYGDEYCKYYYYINEIRYDGVKAYDQPNNDVKEGEFYEILFHPKKNNYSQINLNKRISKDSVCNYFEGDCPFDISE